MKESTKIGLISVFCLLPLSQAEAVPSRKTIPSSSAYELVSTLSQNQDKKRTKLSREVNELEVQFKEICDVYNNYEKKAILEKIKQNEDKINKIHSEIAMLVFIDQKENRDYKEDERVVKFRNMIHKLSDNTIVEHVNLYSLNSPIAQRMKETEQKLASAKVALQRCGG